MMKAKHMFKTALTLLLCYFFTKLWTLKNESILTRSEILPTYSDTRPNIILIVADDLGYNDVGYHGSEIKTPNLDKLAMSGVILENYYVQPVCTPTRGQLLTGRYQIHTGLNWVLSPATPAGLSVDFPTIADKLQESGYSTHMVGKWHLGFYKRELLPTNRGFDSFFGFLSGHSDYYTHQTSNYQDKIMTGYDLLENDQPANISKYEGVYSTHLFANKVKDIIRKQELSKPMFVYLSFQAVHAPLQVPEIFLNWYSNIEDLNRRKYAGMVSCMDEEIGNIVELIQQRGNWNNTVIIFSTDNGGNPKVGGSNWPLKGKKSTFWEGGIRAVGFVHSPLLGFRELGYKSKELMHVTDWFPTIINLAGANATEFDNIDGIDQWACLKYGTPCKRTEILHNIDDTTHPRRRFSLRTGAWKLIIGQTGLKGISVSTSNLSLYNIDNDPLEEDNVFEQFPNIVEKMLQRLEIYEKGMIPSKFPDIDINADPALHGGVWQPWQ
ncbi:arylsulfatase J-like [Ruditapes philippinarum]|uniref:arylsulfatase J-like n=1 Tax=Ruditapes philippinarum TaxID=129788 RepID=UPI00295B660C|nr:arylsulfatase J-like [Ruditapes philippinarum]